MKKKKNGNYGYLSSFSFSDLPDKSNDKEKVRAAKKTLTNLVLVIFNTIVSYIIYAYLTSGSLGYTAAKITLWAYLIILFGFFCAYIIYNKGFMLSNRDPDSFPENWSKEQIFDALEQGKKLKESSKWMLLIIIPLLFTFIIDMADLYIFDYIRSLFES